MNRGGKKGGAKDKGMIFLQPEHPIVREMVLNSLNKYINEPGQGGGRALEPTNTKIADFDGAVYQVIVEPKDPHTFELNLMMKDYANVSRAGGDRALNSLYGQYKANGSFSKERPDLTLRINAGNVNAAHVEDIANLFGLLKRNLLAAPLKIAFEGLQSGSSGGIKPTVLNVRDNEQTIIVPKNDRVIVAVSFCMAEDTDATICEQMLDKMAGASKNSNGPNIKFTRDIPADISSVNGVTSSHNTVGFLLFTISKNHVNAGNMDNVVDLLLDVRHYIHYHIKASKAHLHQRMRAKVKYFLQVLNRARPEQKANIKKYRIINN